MVGRLVHDDELGAVEHADREHELAHLPRARAAALQDTVGPGVQLRHDGQDRSALGIGEGVGAREDRRTLRRITLDDAVKADETFTVLMGEKVEPRKEFIQDNALNVVNLDI